MFGALEFSEKLAGSGIQPIIGCALAIDFGDSDHGPRNVNATLERSRIVLLAQRQEGYRSLMRLNSRAFLDTPANEPPRLKLEWLEGETADIIALTGGPGGPLDMAIAAGQSHFASGRLDALIKLFGNRLYVELQRHVADAVSTGDAAQFLVWKRQKLLVPCVPEDVARHFPPEHRDPDGLYATVRASLCMPAIRLISAASCWLNNKAPAPPRSWCRCTL